MKECWYHVYPSYRVCMTSKEYIKFFDKYSWTAEGGKPIYRIHVRLK